MRVRIRLARRMAGVVRHSPVDGRAPASCGVLGNVGSHVHVAQFVHEVGVVALPGPERHGKGRMARASIMPAQRSDALGLAMG
jgi:hypothetical protein